MGAGRWALGAGRWAGSGQPGRLTVPRDTGPGTQPGDSGGLLKGQRQELPDCWVASVPRTLGTLGFCYLEGRDGELRALSENPEAGCRELGLVGVTLQLSVTLG